MNFIYVYDISELWEKTILGGLDIYIGAKFENANSVIFLLPLGRGSHIELGMAIANNKKIYLCSNNKEDFEKNTINFYEMDNVEHIYGTDDEIYKILIENLY